MKNTPTAFIFHVAIIGAPEIWRRIRMPANQTLSDLHDAIYEAYDRIDDHMFSFYITKPGSRGRSALRDAIEYAHPYTVEDAPSFEYDPPLYAYDGVLSELGLKTRRKFYYRWDYGDEWWHTVKVEQVLKDEQDSKNYEILEKQGKSPDEFKEWPPGYL